MFEDEDDFEIDEEFLDGVFDAEKTANGNLPSQTDVPRKLSPQTVIESSLRKRRLCEQDTMTNASEKVSQTNANSTAIRLKSQPFLEAKAGFSRGKSPQRTPEKSVSTMGNFQRATEASLVYKVLASETSFNHEYHTNAENQCNPSTRNITGSDISFETKKSTCNKVQGSMGHVALSSVSNTFKVCQRKFPGPAGLLPERGQRMFNHSSCEFPDDEVEDSYVPLCSQSALSALEEGPWTTLKSDLALEGRKLLEQYTIAWIKRKAAARQLHGQKVPFLAAVVQNLDCSSPDPCVVLRDATGEIPGTLHRSVWDSFGGQLVVGSALILRLVGVLSTGISARRHYLNITDNNIVTIYSASLDDSYLNIDMPSRGVRKTDVHKWTLNQLLQTVNNWEEQSRKKIHHPHTSSYSTFSSERVANFPSTPDSPVHSSFLQSKQVTPSPTHNQSVNFKSSHLQSDRSVSSHFKDPNHVKPPQSTSSHYNKPSIEKTTPLASIHISEHPGKESPCSYKMPQSRFVPKRPLLSTHMDQANNVQLTQASAAPKSTSNINVENTVPFHKANFLSPDLDDLDVSSVLDGIDSDSLFGEF